MKNLDLVSLLASFTEPISLLETLFSLIPTHRIVFASSLGLEDQVLTHMILNIQPKARIFVLDTGRFYPETYQVMQESMKKYGFSYEVYVPNQKDLEVLLSKKGPFSFYESLENRKECCAIRKVEPLKRALSTADVWITGLRQSQSQSRSHIHPVEVDQDHGLFKVNPLWNWDDSQVWSYVKQNHVIYNPLHDQGFPSIGCQPCTRAVDPGQDSRAGRWWWEQDLQKECGLHVVDGKLTRKKRE